MSTDAKQNTGLLHADGAIEIRATLLSHVGGVPHRLDVHVLDAEAVLEELKNAGAKDVATTLTHLLNLGEAAAEASDNGHKIEITPGNLAELLSGQPDLRSVFSLPPKSAKMKAAKKAATRK